MWILALGYALTNKFFGTFRCYLNLISPWALWIPLREILSLKQHI